LLSLVLGLAPLWAQADQLRVAVASNFSATLEALGRLFQSATGHELLLSAGSSGAIYTQIVNGAPFDLFFSADEERPQRLASEGHARGAGVRVYAQGKLLLWSAQPALIDGAGAVLRSSGWHHLAIANPALAPYGLAAQETLQQLGLWQPVQARLVQGENITQTLQFVQSGNAELGFIAASQYAALPAAQRGSVWEVPADYYSPIRQALVVLTDSPASGALVDFLTTPAAPDEITHAGYRLP
jgi:molybdate transport system substrate-binding protein